MKVYIAKHYWKDGENATWESHVKIDKKIFEYLKKNYHNFVNNRPLMIKEKKRYIYLCYEDNVDIYNRKITNITFFISKNKIDELLCSKVYDNLELTLESNLKNSLLKWFLVMIVVLFFIYNFVFDNKSSDNQITESNNSMLENVVNKNKIKHKNTSETDIKKEPRVIEVKKNKNKSKKEDMPNKVLRDGVKCKIYNIGDTQKEKALKLIYGKVMDKIKFDKTYTLENNKKFKITKNELKELFDNKTLEKKIDEEYSVILEKVQGDNNEQQRK